MGLFKKLAGRLRRGAKKKGDGETADIGLLRPPDSRTKKATAGTAAGLGRGGLGPESVRLPNRHKFGPRSGPAPRLPRAKGHGGKSPSLMTRVGVRLRGMFGG
jgi:hypothetical protein